MGNQTKFTSEIAYEIFKNRDRRFDGLIFVGITSTGIYCRPICPAPQAKFSNCKFYPSAVLAEQAGFRPCLRCKPERSPYSYNAEDISNLVHRATQKIEYAITQDWTLEDLALDLEVSTRHLRRSFVEDLGVTPIKYLQSIRLLRAKQLLGDSDLSVTQVAFASGFKSLRRFNEAFKQQYNLTPSGTRRQSKTQEKELKHKTIHLKCGFRVPYDWDYIISYFHGRSAHAAEMVSDGVYYRTVQIGEHKGWFSVSLSEKDLHLSIHISYSLHPIVSEVIAKIKRQFDVHADPLRINAQLEKDPILKQSVSDNTGLRSPGSFDPFEMLVRVILGQRISVKAATTLMNRYVSTFGEVFETPIPGLERISPLPGVVAKTDASKIASLGMPYKRAETIISVAKAFEQGRLDFTPGANIEELKLELEKIPGIGPWTIEYMLMRGISWPDAFPISDLGVQKALGTKSKKEITSTSNPWQPYRSYATHHLWKMLSSTKRE